MTFERLPPEPVQLSGFDKSAIEPTSGLHGETYLHVKYLRTLAQMHLEQESSIHAVEIAEQAYLEAKGPVGLRPDGEIGPVTQVEYLQQVLEEERSARELEAAKHIATALKLKQERFNNIHDRKTGALNYDGFDAALNIALTHAIEKAEDTPDSYIVLMLTDADHFKAINDTHGHDAGDAMLRHFASVLEKSVRIAPGKDRPKDVIARLGGDEFAILMTGVDSSSTGAIANRIQARTDSAQINYRKESEQGTETIEITSGMSIGAIRVSYASVKQACTNPETGETIVTEHFKRQLREAADQEMMIRKIERHGKASTR